MKTLVGKVLSLPTAKTAIVTVTRVTVHPMYGKRLQREKKYKVHYENEAVVVGATVKIGETRPLSKEKHHKIIEVVKT